MDFKTNTSFNIANTSSHEDFDDDYILIYKDINNILDDIGFQVDDRILCKSIIESLEIEASINIRKDKCVAIPHIGTIQKNWYRSKLISHYKDFKEARKTMTREEYKEYTAKVMEEEKQKHYEEEEKIKTELKFKKKLLPIWIKLSKKHSAAYANLWLYTRDKSPNKEMYVKEVGVIYYLGDPKGPCLQEGLSEKEALKKAIENFDLPKNYQPDILVW